MANPSPILERLLWNWTPLRDPAIRRSLRAVFFLFMAFSAVLACFQFLHLDTEPGGAHWSSSGFAQEFWLYEDASARRAVLADNFEESAGVRLIASQEIEVSLPQRNTFFPTLLGFRPFASFRQISQSPWRRVLETSRLSPTEFAALTSDADRYVVECARHDPDVDPRIAAFLTNGVAKTWEVHWKIIFGNVLVAVELVLAWFMLKNLRVAVLREKALRRLAAGLCPRCSYTLGVPGITVCPECGAEIPPADMVGVG